MAEENVYSVITVTSAEADFEKLLSEAATTLRNAELRLPGLIETMLLRGETKNHFHVITFWESRELWAQSQWDSEIGKTVADIIEGSVSYEIELLTPVLVLQPAKS